MVMPVVVPVVMMHHAAVTPVKRPAEPPADDHPGGKGQDRRMRDGLLDVNDLRVVARDMNHLRIGRLDADDLVFPDVDLVLVLLEDVVLIGRGANGLDGIRG